MTNGRAELRTALGVVIGDRGWSVASNPVLLRAALSDVLGASAGDLRAGLDAVVAAAEEGVPELLREGQADGGSTDEAVSRLEAWGLSSELAEWTVGSWLPLLPPPPANTDAARGVSDSVVAPEPAPDQTALPAAAPELTDLPPAQPILTDLPPAEPVVTELPPSSREQLVVTELPPLTDAPAPATQPPSESGPTASKRRLVVAAVVGTVLLAGIGAAAAIAASGGGGEDGGGPDGDASSSPEPSPTIQTIELAAGDLVGAAGLRLETQTDLPEMASRSTGVRLTGLEELDQADLGDSMAVPAEGARLIGFSLGGGGCEHRPCKAWDKADLSVRIGNESEPIPTGTKTFVVAVPTDVERADLVLDRDGYVQTLSLLDGAPGARNIAVLTRTPRSFTFGRTFPVTETTSRSLAYANGYDGRVITRAVALRGAKLEFFLEDGKKVRRPSAAGRAWLRVNVSYNLEAYLIDGVKQFQSTEISFVPDGGPSVKPILLSDAPAIAFEVPADITRGTLVIGGVGNYSDGNGDPYTATLTRREVTLKLS